MTLFNGFFAAGSRTIDVIFGETFSFTPMQQVVNGNPVADATRDAIAALEAVLTNVAQEIGAGGNVPRIETVPMISVRAVALPQGVRRFDRLTRAAGGAVYEVTGVFPDDIDRIRLSVVEVPA